MRRLNDLTNELWWVAACAVVLLGLLLSSCAALQSVAREALAILDRQIPDENKAPAAYPPAYPASMYE